jgi:hypothetical protein
MATERAEQIIGEAHEMCLNPITGTMQWAGLAGTYQAHIRLLCDELDDVPTLLRNERLTLDSLRRYVRILAINSAQIDELHDFGLQLFGIADELDDAIIDRRSEEQRARDAQELREEMDADDERAATKATAGEPS